MIRRYAALIVKYISSYFKKSIKNKMLIMIVISMVIPLTVVTFLSFIRSSNSMEKEMISSNSRGIVWTGKYIDKTISQLNDVLFTFAVDQNLYSNINKIDDSDMRIEYTSQRYVTDKMFSILYSNNSYNRLMFFTKNKSQLFYVSDEGSTYIANYNIENQEWYDTAKNTFGGTFINNDKFLPNALTFKRSKNEKSFYVLRTLREFINSDFIGVVLLNVKWSVMDDILNILKTEEGSHILITNMDGDIVYNPYGSNIEKSTLKEAIRLIPKDSIKENSYIKTKEYSIFYYKIAKGTMLTIKIIPNNLIVKSARGTLNISIFIMFLSLIVCVLAAIAITHQTTKPIIKLSNSMKSIKNNQLTNVMPTGRLDEIGVLEQSYSYMIEKIKYLIENEYKIKMEKRTAQLKALQAQINPHFLNNTLQLIGGIAISKNVPEIYTIIKAVGNMFLYSIKIEDELVTLQQEILHIKDYLLIQQLRFTDRVDIELNIDESLNQYVLPKLIIQPIVENAFKHGLEKKVGLWKLGIKAVREENKIGIIVEDNGIGIDKDKIQLINKGLDNNLNNVLDIGGSMGVKNVDARIKLYFGERYGIKVESAEQTGTKVMIVFPALLKGEIK